MSTRLTTPGRNSGVLENALGWFADGIALLRADGSLVYANETLRAFAERGDGIRIFARSIEFAASDSQKRLDAALDALARLGGPFCDIYTTDFPVPRKDGTPAYIVSLRPLVGVGSHIAEDAVIILLVRDPLSVITATRRILQELYGLTKAEAHLAQSLCTGTTIVAYARERKLSINTVYTHLKRLREKTGCKSLGELVRKLSELNSPLLTNNHPYQLVD